MKNQNPKPRVPSESNAPVQADRSFQAPSVLLYFASDGMSSWIFSLVSSLHMRTTLIPD